MNNEKELFEIVFKHFSESNPNLETQVSYSGFKKLN